jgi:hypothetical protein
MGDRDSDMNGATTIESVTHRMMRHYVTKAYFT